MTLLLRILPVLALLGLSGLAAAQPAPYLVVPHHTGRVSLVDPTTNTVVRTDAAATNVGEVVPSPDGRRFYLADADAASVRVWDVATGAVVATIPVGGQCVDIAITPDGSTLWVPLFGAQSVAVIDTSTLTVTANIPTGFQPLGVAVTPDGGRALVTSNTNVLMVFDVATRAIVTTIPMTTAGSYIAVHPDGHTAYVSMTLAERVGVINLDTLTETTTIFLGWEPYGLALKPSSSELWIAARPSAVTAGGVMILDTATSNLVTTIPGTGLVANVAFNRDGSRLYASAMIQNVAVSVIDAASRTIVGSISTGFGYPDGIAFGPPIIRNDCGGCSPLSVFEDAGLAGHFGSYVPLFGGSLTLHGNSSTNRTFSLLSDGATRTDSIITVAGNWVFNNPIVGEGRLVKRGDPELVLRAGGTHALGTRIEQGPLALEGGSHPGPVILQTLSAGLWGHGTFGTIQAIDGTIVPEGGVMHAANVTIEPAARLFIKIGGTTPDLYGQLNVSGTANIAGATLFYGYINAFTPPAGAIFTILTNATGQFAGKPEGHTTTTFSPAVKMRLTYHGNDGNDVVLMADGAPTLAGVGDRTIAQDQTLGPVTLGITDDFTTPGLMTVAATSSNQALVTNGSISIGNSNGTRTLTVTPLFGQTGQTTITVTVTDEGGWTTQQSFVLTVIPTRSYYLAEGATGGFFSTDILLANPNDAPAPVTVTFSKDDGTSVTHQMTLAATSRTTVRVNEIAGIEAAAFSTTVVSTSGVPLVVERTMWWDASGYGASTEKAGTEGATTWYFGEGAQGYFHTYFLLFNPNVTATVAHVTYLMEDGPAIEREYPVPAGTRVTIDAGEVSELMHRSFGTRIEFDLPALAERAMYFGETPIYAGGSAAAGVTTPATGWYLAEGATGDFFDTFVLIANPNDEAANLTVTYLRDAGAPIVKTHPLAAHQRLTINIATEDAALANASVSTRVESDRPVVVDRSQYWPHGDSGWYESHASAGQTSPGLQWGLAEGRVGGAADAKTFMLIANPNATAAEITATFLRTDGTTLVKTFSVEPTSRFTLAVTGDAGSHAPELTNESFSTILASTQPVIVERSLYTSANGVIWTAGTNSAGTRLDP